MGIMKDFKHEKYLGYRIEFSKHRPTGIVFTRIYTPKNILLTENKEFRTKNDALISAKTLIKHTNF